jgi:DNA segregation ATPase FtsK/SpoIIIE, S-DNA-T family
MEDTIMTSEPRDDHRNAEIVPLHPEKAQPVPEPPAEVIRADVTSHPWTQAPARRPVLPPWLRHPDQRASAAKWAAVHVSHTAAFHAVRVPVYSLRTALHSPRGAARVIFHAWHWVFDREAHPLRLAAVQAGDASGYAALARIRNQRVRQRLYVLGALAGLLVLVSALVIVAAPGLASWGLPLLAVAVLGWLGRPAGKPFVQPAIVTAKAERLTPDIIIRALGSLSLSGIDKVLREGREITFVSPVVRDGPGWRVAIDLPYGVTVSDVIERREKLASGLRRPLGCVWPEPAADEHAGRLVLFVGDEPLSKARQPVYPLAKAGRADLFKPVPYGTDQRGKPVTLPLMFANLLIGSIPRQGKTVAMRVALLAAALDPLAEIHVHELKGTGDLGPLEKVAHRYGSGADDATIEAALADLRQLADVELIRRAKVIKGLPRDLCPDSKITPQLAANRSLKLHPVVFGLDEAQEAFSHPDHGAAFDKYATALIKRGPALGIMLVLATQRPDAKSLPTGITSNASIRFCLRVMDQVANDMVLGTSSYKRGVNATLLTVSDKGCGYLVGAADAAQVVKTYNVDGPAAEKICDRARQVRAQAGRLTGYAAGEADAAEARVSLLGDVAAVLAPGEAEVWSETICARLGELRPQLYGALDQTSLADQLGRYGVTTKQIWGRTAGGQRANRRGVARADVLAVISSSQAARSSGTDSGQSSP